VGLSPLTSITRIIQNPLSLFIFALYTINNIMQIMYNSRMEIILGIIIVLQLVYIVFKDVKAGQEREKLILKIMSKDIGEYRDLVETVADEPTKNEPPIRIPIEDASLEQILKAEQ
jgi:hypothetical protein